MRQDNIAFPIGIEANTDVERAWETFVGIGEVGSTKVREVIGKSWVKSRKLGIHPDIERAPTVITSDELEEKIKTEDLALAGLISLDKLSDVLHNTKHVVVLANAHGQILHSVGHRQIQNELEKINFRPGGDWSENIVGPNGVGTPIALGRPEVVMGYEHYCKGWQPWVCYGAPIFNAAGNNILGSIDITGPVEKINKETMALTISIAESVQSRMSIIQFHRREVLRELGKQIINRWPNDGVFILDENGLFVEYNAKAKHQLHLNSSSFLNKTISELIPSLSNSFFDCIKNKSDTDITLHIDQKINNTNEFRINFQPITNKGRLIGASIIVKNIPFNMDKNCGAFREIGDDLIKQTLEQTSQNISLTARILGIDRSTIYRRRRKHNW